MKNFLILFLLVFLVACGSAEPPHNGPALEQAQNTAAEATMAVEDGVGEPETAVANPDISITNDAAITPATTPAEAAQVRPQDWAIGANDPLVTIIEYGDFQ